MKDSHFFYKNEWRCNELCLDISTYVSQNLFFMHYVTLFFTEFHKFQNVCLQINKSLVLQVVPLLKLLTVTVLPG